MRARTLRPEYVDYVPKQLPDSGVLYISRRFQTASHLCCCGCGTKIVTPLRQTEYALYDRNGLVSLSPSIGNWNHPCQSHYWIKDNQVVWSAKMSPEAIRLGRERDDALKDAYFVRKAPPPWWQRAVNSLETWIRSLFR